MKWNKKAQENWVFGVGAVLIIIAVIAGVVFFAGFDSVDANHLGVKIKLGKITGTMEPGWEWTGMLTHVEQYDMRLRKVKVDMLDAQSSATDKDGQLVFGSVSVNYKLKGGRTSSNAVPQELYRNVGTDKELANILNIVPIIKEGFKQATVKYEAIEILENRQQVKENAIANIKANFPDEYFEIVDVVVEDIDFSEDFKKAIEEKKIATQNKLKEQEQIEVVKAQQEQEIEKYKAEAERLRLQKTEITQDLINQKIAENWDGKLPTTLIIQGDAGASNMFLQLATGTLNETR